uniref:Bridging integrator 3 n=1 Tax=Canis lupus familiaris TaxID=9615 RepID=A0A8C0RPL0_CANLF
MSWIPFKIGQPKKQIVPKTVERDFEREYGKLQQLEEQTRRLQKDMKKSTDADLAMSKSAVKISLDLLSNPLCEQDQDFLNMVTALDTAMKRMDAFNQEKVNQIQKTVIEPLKKFGSVFPSLNMAVKRREQALQDYRRLQAKVEKYEEKEKTGPVLAKLHQAREELRPVREDFEAKNKQLLDEMPRFYNSRLDYFQPSFESLIRAQLLPVREKAEVQSPHQEGPPAHGRCPASCHLSHSPPQVTKLAARPPPAHLCPWPGCLAPSSGHIRSLQSAITGGAPPSFENTEGEGGAAHPGSGTLSWNLLVSLVAGEKGGRT